MALIDAFDERIAAGHLYGDFQFATAPDSPEFLRTGVLSSYRPVPDDRDIPKDQRRLSQSDWNQLLTLAHTDKRAAFEKFTEFYLATHGQLYWSDTHQLNLYLEDYHGALDHRLGSAVRGSEMITELYVPRSALLSFMNDVRRDFRPNDVDFIYGTIRLIEAEHETALPWARENWACVIFNLHIDHRRDDVARAADHFRRLIDSSLRHGGSYFLTYHRFATAAQVEAAHPAIRQFLAAKRRLDPEGIFQSDWYRHLCGAARMTHRAAGRTASAATLLWSCVALFAARVIGQLETVLARAGVAAGHGRVVLGPAALSTAAAGADRHSHGDVGRRLEPARAQRRFRAFASASRAGAAHVRGNLFRGDGRAARREHQRERRGLLARRRDPRGLPLGAGAIRTGQRPGFSRDRAGADASPATAIRTTKPTTYPTATCQPCAQPLAYGPGFGIQVGHGDAR